MSVKGRTGFVSGERMAQSDAAEVDAWNALKSAPSEAGAKSFIADQPSGYFRPKADALLAKLQAPKRAKKQQAETQSSEAPPAGVAVPQPVAPEAQQAAVTPPAGVTILRIASGFRGDIERFIANSRKFTGKHRFLAVNNGGSRIGIGQCDKTGCWDGCGGMNDIRLEEDGAVAVRRLTHPLPGRGQGRHVRDRVLSSFAYAFPSLLSFRIRSRTIAAATTMAGGDG